MKHILVCVLCISLLFPAYAAADITPMPPQLNWHPFQFEHRRPVTNGTESCNYIQLVHDEAWAYEESVIASIEFNKTFWIREDFDYFNFISEGSGLCTSVGEIQVPKFREPNETPTLIRIEPVMRRNPQTELYSINNELIVRLLQPIPPPVYGFGHEEYSDFVRSGLVINGSALILSCDMSAFYDPWVEGADLIHYYDGYFNAIFYLYNISFNEILVNIAYMIPLSPMNQTITIHLVESFANYQEVSLRNDNPCLQATQNFTYEVIGNISIIEERTYPKIDVSTDWIQFEAPRTYRQEPSNPGWIPDPDPYELLLDEFIEQILQVVTYSIAFLWKERATVIALVALLIVWRNRVGKKAPGGNYQ